MLATASCGVTEAYNTTRPSSRSAGTASRVAAMSCPNAVLRSAVWDVTSKTPSVSALVPSIDRPIEPQAQPERIPITFRGI
ncbi:hypothetical protein LAUMK191_04197 [Mycobacterium attenuatum]|uniref:Uncharacterized protein n=1 Tax=Mycobacterium attenuatum TaxID=2341086 RepID=A0A498Q674_9MYCO|nr:hypothetical protein LAUMK136_04197 [Mycobacterium attenuatum]VBA57801.1 hypothetical protein LAUMK191_04197 [Mycobacterium attenuatum]